MGTTSAQFCLLCVFQFTLFYMYRCVEFSDLLVCLVEAPLLSGGCFAGYRLKGRDKKNVSFCGDADITPIH